MKVVQFLPHAPRSRRTGDTLIVSASVLPMLDFVLRTEFRQVKQKTKFYKEKETHRVKHCALGIHRIIDFW